MSQKSKILYWAHKAVDYGLSPKLILLRAKGAIADSYMRLDQSWFHQLGIRTVLDIGANVGRFSQTIRYLLPKAHIIAFEPLPDCYERMRVLMKGHKYFRALNIGLGVQADELSIQKSMHSPSSSFLFMSETHKKAFPFTAGTEQVKVKVERLDTVINQMHLEPYLMIKVDVQGFEDKVLRGGPNTFKRAKMVLIELSYAELYQGQPLFNDIYQELVKLGFAFHGTLAQMPHPKSGAYLDADCVFLNHSL